ncbi:hypothetical protein PR048_029764 [Dryococelus australis]|uniref:Uncharacterized protein n=1 Tax=Dryococelus australis TaxID=614101 RepID=A0ABQ9G7K7_9NEOP|nr:hypothetical protein PR048_029764 [Dryococelus australis]
MNSSPLKKNYKFNVPLPTSAKGSDIYSDLVLVVNYYGGFSKCSCIVTGPAKCMTSKNSGLVGLLRTNDVYVPVLHFIIHQKVICRKFVKINDVIKIEIKNEFNSADFKQHGRYVIELREEFEKRFSDFDNM